MKVIVIGGGAAGMMAALQAAEGGHSVTILERQARTGRKLLATGNGRCNLTNRNMDPSFYHGSHPDFASPALSAFDMEATLACFEEKGLLTVTEENGRVYPLSDQAGSVGDVLRFALSAAGVEIVTGAEVKEIRKQKECFSISTGEAAFQCDRVILCCGGKAGGKLGGGSWGYELLKPLGHHTTPLSPVLVQIHTDTDFVRSLKGVRADAAVSVREGSKILAESAGEVQFIENGISGPAVFEVSRALSTGKEGLVIHLDLMRNMTEYQITRLLRRRIETMPALTLNDLLTGTVHNRLGRTLIRYAGLSLDLPLTALGSRDIKKITAALKDFRLAYRGNAGFDSAQVTAGGLDTSQFCPETLESRLVPGLYAAGEVLDIDGDCGGYNLQWAWSSGHLAGKLLTANQDRPL